MSRKKQPKTIALYLPQFHRIPENDQWWGQGFTDWRKVKSATPLFEGHYQPRTPLNENYYDQSVLETLHDQVNLAKTYGVYGFCHYHYWFDGKQLLEKPTNLLLNSKDLNFPFCLSWANESWVKRWDGHHHHVLIKQTHPPLKESWQAHFDYLINAWSDERAIKVDERPVFIIYRPQYIPKIAQMLDFWREKAMESGLKGIYFIAQKQFEFPSANCLKSFDAIFQFQPFASLYALGYSMNSGRRNKLLSITRLLPESVQDMLRSIHTRRIGQPTILNYDEIWSHAIHERTQSGMVVYPGVFVDWDNTARYKNRATIVSGASPERFGYWLEKMLKSLEARNLPEPLVFLNAWNEWAESAYLEPDSVHGYGYLEALNQALSHCHTQQNDSALA